MTGAFRVPFRGGEVLFREQNALQQLEIARQAAGLMPLLTARGLEYRAAYALAYNCALLSQTLAGADAFGGGAERALRLFRLSEIAELARLYFEHGDLPFGDGYDEGAVSESFDGAFFPSEQEGADV